MLNKDEFKLIRAEMANVKDCITKYIGYIFAGSGAAVYGIARIDKLNDSMFVSMSFVSIAISVIISFVSLIIFYKFHSHNRFAGYCKLLSHEKYEIQKDSNICMSFSWELAVGKLRCLDLNEDTLAELTKDMKVKNLDTEKLINKISDTTAVKSKLDKFLGGARILFSALFGKVKTNSWAFPPFVASVCFVLSLSFYVAGFFLATMKCPVPFKLYFVLLISGVFQFALWARLIAKLYDLVDGGLTVESFFVKFIPIRVAFLKEYGVSPEYLDLGELSSNSAGCSILTKSS